MNNEFYEEFSKLSEKDRKEVINLMQYKIHIDNKNFKNRVEYLENIIEGLESDVRVLGEHIEDDCTAHEEAIKWCTEAHELAIENKELKQRINLYKSVINDIKHILNNQMDYREFVDIVNAIEEILERVNYEI